MELLFFFIGLGVGAFLGILIYIVVCVIIDKVYESKEIKRKFASMEEMLRALTSSPTPNPTPKEPTISKSQEPDEVINIQKYKRR